MLATPRSPPPFRLLPLAPPLDVFPPLVPAAVPLDPAWNVPAGEDSEEGPRQSHEDAATLAAVYPGAALIPDQPRAPPAGEPEHDDALTPEITTLDLKQQQQQQQAAAAAAVVGEGGDGEEDAEYQAALAEAYGAAHDTARSSSGAAGEPRGTGTGARDSKGRSAADGLAPGLFGGTLSRRVLVRFDNMLSGSETFRLK